MRLLGWTCFALFVGSIWAANYAVEHYGVLDVGFGLMAPAAVFVVGVALTLRDLVQRTLGVAPVILAILLGAGLSLLVSPAFAAASCVAFLFSELADLAVYTPLEKKNLPLAVGASNAVGLVVDSVLFLWISPLVVSEFLPGQVVGKAYMTLAALALLVPLRRLVPARA